MRLHTDHPKMRYLDGMSLHIGDASINSNVIRLPVHRLGVLEGFPGHENSVVYEHCTLVFHNAVSATRTIAEYDATGLGFKNEETITEWTFEPGDEDTYECPIGGVSDERNAWVSWMIEATDIAIEE